MSKHLDTSYCPNSNPTLGPMSRLSHIHLRVCCVAKKRQSKEECRFGIQGGWSALSQVTDPQDLYLLQQLLQW